MALGLAWWNPYWPPSGVDALPGKTSAWLARALACFNTSGSFNEALPEFSDGSPHLGIHVAVRIRVGFVFITAHHLPLVAIGIAVRR